MRVTLLATILIAATSLLSVGCGGGIKDNEVKVSGNVTIDGQPIEIGSVSFVSADGSTPTGGGNIKDGAYVAFVAPGEKKVLVLGNKLVGKEKLYDTPDSPTRDMYEKVTPPEYNAVHLTPLTATINSEQDGLNFELTSKVKAKR
ncbi:hypothetical protein LOC68_15615 [Blastopirellula sp. JC732]|uniref:Carboxypeptidase regulatory-like domain-containing protein n=1 Tax=Blastopirellula sediminis TaxID=2894196 RepID=A0A9X1SH81_9BACT|nr:hypothetical protein [Blastopirellula sediminis]MCC9606887.1 hypothetical protein [Blastopirellula sediminis]MCC9629817.1 hypothetical protein [Blastopirellula sediminis]